MADNLEKYKDLLDDLGEEVEPATNANGVADGLTL